MLFTQTASVRSMHLAAKLGFTGVERFEGGGAEQWLGRRPADCPARYPYVRAFIRIYGGALRWPSIMSTR